MSLPSSTCFALGDAQAEPRQVVFAGLVKLRQYGRFAADQGAPGINAAIADSLNHLGCQVGVVAAHRHVVKEQERLGPGAEAVVDRHGHEVDADSGVSAGGEGQLQLRAHTVGGGDEYRVAIAPRQQPDLVVEAEKTGESVFPLDDPLGVRPPHQWRKSGDRLIISRKVYSGRSIVHGGQWLVASGVSVRWVERSVGPRQEPQRIGGPHFIRPTLRA